MGGEKYKVHVYNTVDKGSPPHGRGKDDTAVQLGARAGITPAWAGKSVSRRPRWTHTGDHPRVGGEKYHKGGLPAAQRGSPPRRRGKGPALHCSSPAPGITPA